MKIKKADKRLDAIVLFSPLPDMDWSHDFACAGGRILDTLDVLAIPVIARYAAYRLSSSSVHYHGRIHMAGFFQAIDEQYRSVSHMRAELRQSYYAKANRL